MRWLLGMKRQAAAGLLCSAVAWATAFRTATRRHRLTRSPTTPASVASRGYFVCSQAVGCPCGAELAACGQLRAESRLRQPAGAIPCGVFPDSGEITRRMLDNGFGGNYGRCHHGRNSVAAAFQAGIRPGHVPAGVIPARNGSRVSRAFRGRANRDPVPIAPSFRRVGHTLVVGSDRAMLRASECPNAYGAVQLRRHPRQLSGGQFDCQWFDAVWDDQRWGQRRLWDDLRRACAGWDANGSLQLQFRRDPRHFPVGQFDCRRFGPVWDDQRWGQQRLWDDLRRAHGGRDANRSLQLRQHSRQHAVRQFDCHRFDALWDDDSGRQQWRRSDLQRAHGGRHSNRSLQFRRHPRQ